MMKRTILSLSCILAASLSVHAGELISGNILSSFAPTKQWHRVASVEMNADEPKNMTSVASESGKILLNSDTKTRRLPYLLTKESYGDVEIALEYMIPKGSNAGVYVMGRYEVQILDSHGKADKDLQFSDMGAIYQRYIEKNEVQPDEKPGGYEGTPPLTNAAKAAGEWQRLEIQFQAPRFDAKGKKTQNARFLSVHLNGTLVQKDVEVTGPTRSNPLKGEAATGPISIQGDHGPVAIRSFVVKPL